MVGLLWRAVSIAVRGDVCYAYAIVGKKVLPPLHACNPEHKRLFDGSLRAGGVSSCRSDDGSVAALQRWGSSAGQGE